MSLPTFADVVNAKRLTPSERLTDFVKLTQWDGTDNGIKLIGNPYIQSYMTEHMGKTRFEGKPSLKEVLDDPRLSQTLYKHTSTKTRLEFNMPQAFSRMNPICFMKPSAAKYIYTTFKATKVLDFTAGWGGRMLGALASGIDYIGIDTNISLRPAYEAMMTELASHTEGKAQMIWEDCRNVDFSTLDYDFVFTSPPYCNKELYEHMTPFESPAKFYTDFLIPTMEKSLKHIKNNGWVCLNIDPDDYKALCCYGFRTADRIEEFQQSSRKRKDGSVKMEKVYCWKAGGLPSAPSQTPVSVSAPVAPSCVGCERCRELEQEVARLKAALRNLLG